MAIAGLYKIFNHWHQTGTVYIYSDPHFNDPDLPNRPSAEKQVQHINSKCGKADTLIILGDVGDISYVPKLRARYKILIMGNHDAGRSNYERHRYYEKFDANKYTKQEALAEMVKKYPNCRYRAEEIYNTQFEPFKFWYVEADNGLFDEVYEGPLMIAEKLILSHEPVDVPWAFNIHGHTHHLRSDYDKRHYCVCADAIGFIPVNFNQWMKSGYLSRIETIHRETIDKAIVRKKKRGGKKIGEK